MIDGSELLSKYKIRSRFEDITLNTDQLSTGCKTVLNVLYFPDKVFCLKECGNNALEILYSCLLYTSGRNINKYHRFLHDEIKKFEGKTEEKTA